MELKQSNFSGAVGVGSTSFSKTVPGNDKALSFAPTVSIESAVEKN
jgi:hypothetical protein